MSEEATNSLGLIQIPIEYLWDGLVLNDPLYNYDGSTLLIPAGEIITRSRLEKLENFKYADRYIMTKTDSWRYIMQAKEKPWLIRQKMREYETGYSELMQSVDRVLHISSEMANIDSEAARNVTQDVYKKLLVVENVDLFQCVNVPRPLDEALQRHSLNVAFLNGVMGRWIGLDEEDIRLLILAGLLHDIGKTKIPSEILDAQRRLTLEEFAMIKKHPVYSFKLLGEDIEETVKSAVLGHHERLDGSGYPNGLKGEAVPFFAQITAIADVYDAMISKRSYKKAIIPFEILAQFQNQFFEGLNEQLVTLFVKNTVKCYRNQQVITSDGNKGEVVFIPSNDIAHPIIRTQNGIRQTGENYQCVMIL